MGYITPQPGDSIQIRYSHRHHIRGRGLAQLDFQTRQKQIATNTDIILHIPNEGLQNCLT